MMKQTAKRQIIRRPKAPVKPLKPIAPVKPQVQTKMLDLRNGLSIEDVINELKIDEPDLKLSDAFIKSEYYGLAFVYRVSDAHEDKAYVRRLNKYNKERAAYPEKIAAWRKETEEYKIKLEEFQAWIAQQKLEKLRAEVEKIETQLEEQGKKSMGL